MAASHTLSSSFPPPTHAVTFTYAQPPHPQQSHMLRSRAGQWDKPGRGETIKNLTIDIKSATMNPLHCMYSVQVGQPRVRRVSVYLPTPPNTLQNNRLPTTLTAVRFTLPRISTNTSPPTSPASSWPPTAPVSALKGSPYRSTMANHTSPPVCVSHLTACLRLQCHEMHCWQPPPYLPPWSMRSPLLPAHSPATPSTKATPTPCAGPPRISPGSPPAPRLARPKLAPSIPCPVRIPPPRAAVTNNPAVGSKCTAPTRTCTCSPRKERS